ncbi:MAG: SAM-dependent methyltransferase [Janthinobacterium lividum]
MPITSIGFICPNSGLGQYEEVLYAKLLGLVPANAHLIAPWEGDFHPDHEVCGRAAIRLVKAKGLLLTSYFFWTWHRGTPDLIRGLPLVKLALTPGLQAAKREALLCHASQLHHPDGKPILPDSLLEPAWRDTEAFFPAWDPTRTSAAFFEAKYSSDPDPWDFASSEDELARYRASMAALAGKHFRHALEPACSIGVLTAKLAQICDRVSASDVSHTAVARAAERCADLPNVEVRCASLTDLVPDPSVDLLVLSEIGYYFTAEDWNRILQQMIASLNAGCTILGVHWLGVSEDHITSGDEVHTILRANPRLQLLHGTRQGSFRLDLFRVIPA